MRRRALLAAVATGVAGCAAPKTAGTPTTESTTSTTTAVPDEDSPGPDGESRFTGRSLPPLGDDAVQWYHEADRTTVAYLEPSEERIELDGLVEFEMVNNSDESLGCGHWDLYKLVDGEWFHVSPTIHHLDCQQLPAGQREEWPFRAFNGDDGPAGAEPPCGLGLTLGSLGGGEYAVAVGYGHPVEKSGALVELVGEPVTLIPTGGAEIEDLGDEVRVTTEEHWTGEAPVDAAFELTRGNEADERLIAEQVIHGGDVPYGKYGLRNALAVMDETVDRVVVRSNEDVIDTALALADSVRRFRFRGQAYRAARIDADE